MWSFKEFWLTEKTKKQERETVRDENQINSLCEAGFFSTAIPFAQHQVCCRELTVNNITAWDGSVVKCAAMPESRWPPSNRNARGSCWPGAGAEAAPLQWGLHAELGDTPGCWPRLGCGLGSLICCRFLKQFLSLAYKWGTWGKEREIEPVCIPFLEFSPLRQNHQNWLRECEGKCIKNYEVLRHEDEGEWVNTDDRFITTSVYMERIGLIKVTGVSGLVTMAYVLCLHWNHLSYSFCTSNR